MRDVSPNVHECCVGSVLIGVECRSCAGLTERYHVEFRGGGAVHVAVPAGDLSRSLVQNIHGFRPS